jgi:hypothetical protein
MNAVFVKVGIAAMCAALLGIGTASWLSRGARIENLEAWQSTVTLATAQASNAKSLKPEQVPTAIAVLRGDRDRAEAVLAGIDKAALQDKVIQARLDSQLSAILDSQDQSAEGTRARLTDLLTRQATGDRDKDCLAMAADSNAAWDGWSK